MFSRFKFSTILALPIIIPAAISDLDSTWSLEDDSLFINAELPSVNPAPFSLDQSLIPLYSNAPLLSSTQIFEDAVSSTSNDIDTSDAFPWNIDTGVIPPSSGTANSNNDKFDFFDEDDSYKTLADCSTSGSLLAFDISKRRPRRRAGGGGEKCTNPGTTPPTSSQSIPSSSSPDNINLDQLWELLTSPEMLNKATAIEDPYQNTPCFLLTGGRLPWGVCSSGQPGGQRRALYYAELAGLPLATWSLSRATLGTFFFFKIKIKRPFLIYPLILPCISLIAISFS